MPSPTEQLILRGMHLIMRASFSPNEPVAQAKHMLGIQNDIGPWFTDYVTVMSEPEQPKQTEPGYDGGEIHQH